MDTQGSLGVQSSVNIFQGGRVKQLEMTSKHGASKVTHNSMITKRVTGQFIYLYKIVHFKETVHTSDIL